MTIIIDEDFNSFDKDIWGCEYQCPTVSNGYARFSIFPGNLNTNQTWSKIIYNPQKQNLGYGTYSAIFRFNRRPLETEIWSGIALWDNNQPDSSANEVNFGIDTACVSRCDDTTLILESYKSGKNAEIICKTGKNLFDGTFHNGTIVYSNSKIELFLDGKLVGSNTDASTIPTSRMTFMPGARVVTGKISSQFYMDIDRIIITDSWLGCPTL